MDFSNAWIGGNLLPRSSFRGAIAEILVYRTALASSQEVDAYLQEKYPPP